MMTPLSLLLSILCPSTLPRLNYKDVSQDDQPQKQYCCQGETPDKQLCKTSSSCIVKDLDGTVGNSEFCQVKQDDKFESVNRSIDSVRDCMTLHWDEHDTFNEHDQLPFYIEMFALQIQGGNLIGLDLRMHYIEFVSAIFRVMNLHHCGNPFAEISARCNPRCVRLAKTDKRDNQAFLSYDCEAAYTLPGLASSAGDTYLISMCMTNTGEDQRCGEYWFLIPSDNATLDRRRPDHHVVLLVDKEEYETNSEVIVYVPTSHVLLHDADMLSIQLLHDSNLELEGKESFSNNSCWHSISTSSIIHTQNVTFNKYPGQNIRVRLTHHLPSGRYQVAMIPYAKDENNTLVSLAPPSCTCVLERMNLGRHGLTIIFVMLLMVVILAVITSRMTQEQRVIVEEKENDDVDEDDEEREDDSEDEELMDIVSRCLLAEDKLDTSQTSSPIRKAVNTRQLIKM